MYTYTLRNIIIFIAAMVFLAGCDPYASWGPMCVNPVDNFKMAVNKEVKAENQNWVNTNITLTGSEQLDFELMPDNNYVPITLCGREEYRTDTSGGREKINVSLNATTASWTNAPDDIKKLNKDDLVLITLGSPNSLGGAAGNKWALWSINTECNAPGSGGKPCGGGSGPGTGSPPWDDKKDAFSKDASNIGNNACAYPNKGTNPITGKPCWHVYGTAVMYRINANKNDIIASAQGDGTEMVPYRLKHTADPGGQQIDGFTPGDVKIQDLSEPDRKMVIIDPVTSAGYLQFRMDDQVGQYGNNMGGITMDVAHYGCPRRNGDGLVAYIGTTAPDKDTAPTWTSPFLKLNETTLKYETSITKPPAGTLWLKIDDPDGDYSTASNMGSYKVGIKIRSNGCTLSEDKTKCNPDRPNDIMSSVVEYVVEKIEGVLRTAQKDLFEGLAGVNTQTNKVGTLVSGIRACLVLYIAIYGVSFAFGLISSPQYDFIVRVVKVAIIVQLLSPNAWNFFNTHFFTLFTDGVKYIVYMLNNLFETENVYGSGQAWVNDMNAGWAAGGGRISFDFIDTTVGQFLEPKFWVKLLGLLFAGPLGWLYIIAIIIGMVIFIKGVIQAVLAYVISLVAMAMLIGVSPLFFTFMLFSQTKDMFEAWVQQVINYAMRPIFMFTVLAIFNFLMWASLTRMMSYGVCWKCILNIKFDIDFLPNLCVLYFYQPFTYDNFGDTPNTTMPISFFSVIAFLIIASLMEKFVPFMEGLASSITSSTAKASILAPVAAITNDLKKPFGMDKDSVQRRATEAANAKKVEGIKRGLIAEQNRQAGGVGMPKFDAQQKQERKQELDQLKRDVQKGGSVKDRAAMLDQKMKGNSVKDRAKMFDQKMKGQPPVPPPKPNIKLKPLKKGDNNPKAPPLPPKPGSNPPPLPPKPGNREGVNVPPPPPPPPPVYVPPVSKRLTPQPKPGKDDKKGKNDGDKKN